MPVQPKLRADRVSATHIGHLTCTYTTCVCVLPRSQAAQPLAAKLLSGAQNASFQANATRDAARQAVSEAQQKLAALREQLKAAKSTRNAAKQALIGAPAQWGKAQFRVSRGTECG